MKKRQCYLLIISIILLVGFGTFIWFYQDTPTAPEFSADSGFYNNDFNLEIKADKGSTIYYTTDSSEPTVDSTKYDGSILLSDASANDNYYCEIPGTSPYGDNTPVEKVDKCNVIRAIAVDKFGKISDESIGVYFVGFDQKSEYENVMVMSLVLDPNDLFSSDNGLYMLGDTYSKYLEDLAAGTTAETSQANVPANYRAVGDQWRKNSRLTLFSEDGTKIVDQDIKIGIHGGWSRANKQKPFNLYPYDNLDYGDYDFSYLMLRTSGARDTNQTMFRDVLNQRLVENRDVATQNATPCIVFLEGEFWGVYNLQERYKDGYYSDNYDIAENNLLSDENAFWADYQAMQAFAENNDMTDESNYERMSEWIDMQSFIDYNCIECYVANADWPSNNWAMFRSKGVDSSNQYEDGRWRWALYDTDDSTGIDLQSEIMAQAISNPFTSESHWAGTPFTFQPMNGLIKNMDFQQAFIVTFMDIINTNYEYSNVHAKINELANIYRGPMVKTIKEFVINREVAGEYTDEDYVSYFDAKVAEIDNFYKERPAYVIEHLKNTFNLSNTFTITINMDKKRGTLTVNTATPDLKNDTFAGQYFADYPITVSVEPAKGYEFIGWKDEEGIIVSNDSSLTINLTQDIVLIPEFRKAN